MTTSGACGDITRNVVGCTLSGLAHDEIVDGYATAEAIHEHFLDNKLYSNLPRKYKISVTGCTEDCARGLINDIALSGVIAEDGTRGFNLRVGGGLSTQPRFARWMDVFVTPEEAPEVIEGMTGDLPRRRGEPEGARQGPPEVPRRPRRPRRPARGARAPRRPPAAPRRPEAPRPRARTTSASSPGPTTPSARSAWSCRSGACAPPSCRGSPTSPASTAPATDDALRLTHQQNVLLPWIPAEQVDALLLEPLITDLTPTPTLFQRGLQTCTGKEFCGLAKVFTKSRAVEISKFLDEHVRPNGHGEDFRLHFAGCSSSCAQHQIADVGIEGVLKKVDGEFVEAMDIRIGGRLGPSPKFGDVVIKKVPHWELNDTLLRIFTLYETHHGDGETFRDFAGRTEPQWWTNELAPVEEPVT